MLGKDDFLKLMMVQLQHQDPLQPSDPSQYLSQLAQFTTMEQMTNIAQSSAAASSEQRTTQALALLGHGVTYTAADGTTVSGTVQKVSFGPSGPLLTINGTTGIQPSQVTEVS
jgi:flagellar basal-body rod modification protein FlgD